MSSERLESTIRAMDLGSFDYELPADRIALWPVEAVTGERASAKLLVARLGLSEQDLTFSDLPELLHTGDLLIFNDSPVIKRRIFARAASGREVELFVYRESENGVCEALARPARRLRTGDILSLPNGVQCEVLGRAAGGESVKVQLVLSQFGSEAVRAALDEAGVMPIPPYIRHGKAEAADERFYQNVFARSAASRSDASESKADERAAARPPGSVPAGSVAAPTAGLHFDQQLLARLERKGIGRAYVTLHVGLWSILPQSRTQTVAVIGNLGNGDVEDGQAVTHSAQVGREVFYFPRATALAIAKAKDAGRRVIAVGTTTCRVLETVYQSRAVSLGGKGGGEDEWQETDLAITPGWTFRIVDALITNFHQPGSTHLALVSAFFGRERMQQLYQHALDHNYRFLSYGDGMLLLK